MNIKALLKNIVNYNASDLHIVSRSEPQIRIDGALVPLDMNKLDGPTIEEMCYTLLSDKQKKNLEEDKELDFALELPGIGRFRANYYYTMNGELAAAFRIIPIEIP
ncbi:MAG: type IV pili twitching motility protein PilT, partial [Campylobacteraceae bacterium]|nr:type IV pili twitching motility protein PilT [Campylobacteraceae bacterium]